MPIPNDYHEIITTLFEKTEQGVLSWKTESLHVSVVIDKSKFSLWAGDDERTEEPFVAFGLYNNINKLLDSWFLDESDTDYSKVYRLYKAAQRQANGVPTLLKNLAESLSSMKKISGDES